MTDCLETLHELAIEGREQFEAGGGQAEEFMAIPCLNDHEDWLDFLAGTCRKKRPRMVNQKNRLVHRSFLLQTRRLAISIVKHEESKGYLCCKLLIFRSQFMEPLLVLQGQRKINQLGNLTRL